jgi:hypothetical protein
MTTPELPYHGLTAVPVSTDGLPHPPVFVGFSTPRRWNPLSALIRRMMNSQTSHVWLLVEDPLFELRLVLEAHSTGFRLISLAQFVKDNKVVRLLQPAHSLRSGLPEAGGWLGDEYDVRGLFGIFLTQVAKWFRIKTMKNPFTSARSLFCSEAVVRVLKAAHYPGADQFHDETTTPAELLSFFEAEPGAKVISGEQLNLWHHLKKAGPQKARRKPRPSKKG